MIAILEHIAALADQTRCRMLLLLDKHELTVSELCAVLQMPQSTVSRHLKLLADDNWVTSRRDGTSRFYSMATDDLGLGAKQLWPVIRAEMSATAAASQDDRRLRRALLERRAKSQAFFATAARNWDRLRGDLFGHTFLQWSALGLIDRDLVVGDLGCGTGELAQVMAPFVRRVIGIDGSTEMLDAARQRLVDVPNVELRRGELESLPLGPGELHAAMLSLVLHHSPAPAKALSEVGRVVRVGGRVLVVDMLPHDREEYQRHMGHVWLGFSEKQVTRFLSTAGFGDIQVRRVPGDPDAKGPPLFAAVGVKRG